MIKLIFNPANCVIIPNNKSFLFENKYKKVKIFIPNKFKITFFPILIKSPLTSIYKTIIYINSEITPIFLCKIFCLKILIGYLLSFLPFTILLNA